MRRNACLFGTLVLTVTLAGCNNPKKNNDTQSASAYDYESPLVYEPAAQPAPASDYSSSMMASAPYESYPGAASPVGDGGYGAGGGRTHVVSKGDTLYSLARRYYNDQRRWRDIYEANRSSLPDPNMIRVGQTLVIP